MSLPERKPGDATPNYPAEQGALTAAPFVPPMGQLPGEKWHRLRVDNLDFGITYTSDKGLVTC